MSEWERRMGLHSGYPACCVEEFLETARDRQASARVLFEKRQHVGIARWRSIGLDYVPCWSCLDRILEGKQAPVKQDHRCRVQRRPECVELIEQFETLTGAKL